MKSIIFTLLITLLFCTICTVEARRKRNRHDGVTPSTPSIPSTSTSILTSISTPTATPTPSTSANTALPSIPTTTTTNNSPSPFTPIFNTPAPADAVIYTPNGTTFDIINFNAFLYSTDSKYIVIPAGTYYGVVNMNEYSQDGGNQFQLGHWNLNSMVLDFRGVNLHLGVDEFSYWDVETNLTIVGLNLWTDAELWVQGVVSAVTPNPSTDNDKNGHPTVTITVDSDVGYNYTIWTDGDTPTQPLLIVDPITKKAVSGCNNYYLDASQAQALGNNQASVVATIDDSCPSLVVGALVAKASANGIRLIIQEASNINWIDITTNLFFDSYGASTPVYQNCAIINLPPPEGSSVARIHPAIYNVQGWNQPATLSWYYLGFSNNGRDAVPIINNAVVQASGDPNDLQPWW